MRWQGLYQFIADRAAPVLGRVQSRVVQSAALRVMPAAIVALGAIAFPERVWRIPAERTGR